MILLDTSVIISFFNEEDVLHGKAVEKFAEFEKEGRNLAVSSYILNEAATIMLRKGGLERAKKMLDFLVDYERLEVFHVDGEGFFEVVAAFKAQDDGLSFVDCSIVWMAKAHAFEVATFDKNLLERLEKSWQEFFSIGTEFQSKDKASQNFVRIGIWKFQSNEKIKRKKEGLFRAVRFEQRGDFIAA